MTSTIRGDLRRLPLWAAFGLVVLALVVLAIRMVALLACLIDVAVAVLADLACRAETAATTKAGIAPLAATTFTVPMEWR
jgi:ABC-type protease/lipase transport system fused ATPase/permease subunit